MYLQKSTIAFAYIVYLRCMTTEAVLLTLCKDRRCTQGCLSANLNDYNYMPECAFKDDYQSLRIENPCQPTNFYVTKHHYCSYYGGIKNPGKKQLQKAALLQVGVGDNRCHDAANSGQNKGTTVIKSACVANPNRLRPGDAAPPPDMPPIIPSNQFRWVSHPYERWL